MTSCREYLKVSVCVWASFTRVKRSWSDSQSRSGDDVCVYAHKRGQTWTLLDGAAYYFRQPEIKCILVNELNDSSKHISCLDYFFCIRITRGIVSALLWTQTHRNACLIARRHITNENSVFYKWLTILNKFEILWWCNYSLKQKKICLCSYRLPNICRRSDFLRLALTPPDWKVAQKSFQLLVDLNWPNDFVCSFRKRRGAFNSKQLLYLEKYRPKMRLRFKDANGHNCCVQ